MGKAGGFMGGRALSTIIATMIVLVIAIAAVAIVWTVIRNVIQDSSQQISLNKITIELKISGVQTNGTDVKVIVQRKVGVGNVAGIKFIFDDGNTTETLERKIEIKELEKKSFILTPAKINIQNLKRVSIAPIIKMDDGKEIIGNIADSYEISSKGMPSTTWIETGEGGEEIPLPCTEDNECNDNNLGTKDTCFGGACYNTPITQCIAEDGFCPSSCTSETDSDCVECVLNSDCNDNNACTNDLCLNGYCTQQQKSLCENGDGCCPFGCVSGSDNDCSIECYTNLQCNDGHPSTIDTCVNYFCINTEITSCTDNDNYCPDGCTYLNDNNCAQVLWQTGLISWWKFDGNTDDEMEVNDGTLNGAEVVPGKFNQGYFFDGVNDYVSCGSFSISGSEITIAGWINPSNLENQNCVNGECIIISKSISTQLEDQYWTVSTTDLEGEKRLKFIIRTVNGVSELSAISGTLQNSVWTHFAVVYNGDSMIVYIDGQPSGSSLKTGLINTNNGVEVWIGSSPPSVSNPFNGIIDEVMVFNRALDSSEVLALYNENLS